MSIKPTDVWCSTGTATRPSQPNIDQGWECGPANPYYMNWTLKSVSESCVGNIHKWALVRANEGGYIHPAVVLGSDNILYATTSGLADTTQNPVGNMGVDWVKYSAGIFPPNYMDGLYIRTSPLSPSPSWWPEVAISPGACTSSDGTNGVLSVSLYKSLTTSPWVPGGAGVAGKPAAVVLATGWYRVFMVVKPNGTTDFGLDSSPVAANLLAEAGVYGFTSYRFRGWVYYNSVQGAFKAFDMDSEWRFRWINHQPANPDYFSAAINNAGYDLATVFAPPLTVAEMVARAEPLSAGSQYVLVTGQSSLVNTPVTASHATLATAAGGGWLSHSETLVRVNTDASSRVKVRASSAPGSVNIRLVVVAWEDKGAA